MVTLADLWDLNHWDKNSLPKNQPGELNSITVFKHDSLKKYLMGISYPFIQIKQDLKMFPSFLEAPQSKSLKSQTRRSKPLEPPKT